MIIKETFIVPGYYEEFSCKCGECRHTCCSGLAVNISRNEFFHLVGMACSDKLRRKLDDALKVRDDADENRYAQIVPDWYGNCHLLNEDGFCMLQRECTEEALTAVCRYFPRSPKTEYGYECSCSAGCEKVTELLMKYKLPMKFTEKEMSFTLPSYGKPADEKISAFYFRVQMQLIHIMQDRERLIPERIETAGSFLKNLEPFIESKDIDMAEKEMSRAEKAEGFSVLPETEDITKIMKLIDWCGKEYASLAEYAGRIPWDLDTIMLNAAENRLILKQSGLFVFFEQLLVNDIFYMFSPFTGSRIKFSDEYEVLKIIYSMMMIFSAYNSENEVMLTDCMSAFFRAVELTDFRHNMIVLMHEDDDNGNDNDNGNAA